MKKAQFKTKEMTYTETYSLILIDIFIIDTAFNYSGSYVIKLLINIKSIVKFTRINEISSPHKVVILGAAKVFLRKSRNVYISK